MTCTISDIFIYPVKSLCGISVKEVDFVLGVGLKYDREWALLDNHLQYVNGKVYPACHKIKLLNFTPPSLFTLSFDNGMANREEVTIDFDKDPKEAEQWFSKVFKRPVTLIKKEKDDPRFDGPTVVSRASLDAVQSWFGIEDAIGRFRPNLVVEGVPAFWEDQLITEDETRGSQIKIGKNAVEIAAVFPVHRCVVPSRASSRTEQPGKVTQKFIEDFQQKRKDNYHPNSPVKRLTSNPEKNRESYYFCTATTILKSGKVNVGDSFNQLDSILLQPQMQATHALTKTYMRRLFNGFFAIRGMPKSVFYFAMFLIELFPPAFSAHFLIRGLPESVRKPTGSELTFAVLNVLAVVLVMVFILYRYLF